MLILLCGVADMKKFLVVVDMQNDFIDGSLGTSEAVSIVDNAAEKIKNFDGEIFVTLDTHYDDYLQTSEGKNLPVPHCIKETDGWNLNKKIVSALNGKNYVTVEKSTFGSTKLPNLIQEAAHDKDFNIELIGLCTDICVVSNALILKAAFYENEIFVDSHCCAGVTPQTHNSAIEIMKMCQIIVK